MKMKLLSAMVVLGLFALCTNNAEALFGFGQKSTTVTGQPQKPKCLTNKSEADYVNQMTGFLNLTLCSQLTQSVKGTDMMTACTPFCTSIKGKEVPSKVDTQACAAELVKEGNAPAPSDPRLAKAQQIAKTMVSKVPDAFCFAACTGVQNVPLVGPVGCNSCQFDKVAAFCGRICNAFPGAASKLGNCFVTNPDKAHYNN